MSRRRSNKASNVHSRSHKSKHENNNTDKNNNNIEIVCSGCDDVIVDTKLAVKAVGKCWHIPCFTCFRCGTTLKDEFIARRGVPYCEKDYMELFGVACNGCGGYLKGWVIEAGNQHYHTRCARCTRCGETFCIDEDMYILKNDIWHERCHEKGKGSKFTKSETGKIDGIEKRKENLRRSGIESWVEKGSGNRPKLSLKDGKIVSSVNNSKSGDPVDTNDYSKPNQNSQIPVKAPGFYRSGTSPVIKASSLHNGKLIAQEDWKRCNSDLSSNNIPVSRRCVNNPLLSADIGCRSKSLLHWRDMKNKHW